MRKIIFSFAALSAVFAVSCSNSDKNTPVPNTNIVGNWITTGTGIKYYDANNNLLSSQYDPYGLIGSKYAFSSTTYYVFNEGYIDSASYTLNTNVNPMTLTISGNEETASILSLTASQMVWQVESYRVGTTYGVRTDTLAKQQ